MDSAAEAEKPDSGGEAAEDDEDDEGHTLATAISRDAQAPAPAQASASASASHSASASKRQRKRLTVEDHGGKKLKCVYVYDRQPAAVNRSVRRNVCYATDL